jgi:hypothetical protein
MAKKIEKTNAARLLDRAKIPYGLIPYEFDENNLAALGGIVLSEFQILSSMEQV